MIVYVVLMDVYDFGKLSITEIKGIFRDIFNAYKLKEDLEKEFPDNVVFIDSHTVD